MPPGSSSEAPLISPGPSTAKTLGQELWGPARRRRRWPRPNSMRVLQEVAQQLQKDLQLIVMHPVTGPVHRDDFRVPEMREAPVRLGVRPPRPAFLAVD